MTIPATLHPKTYAILCGLVGLALGGTCGMELRRVERGQLFLLALPGDAAPSMHEVADAQATSQRFLLPAMGVVCVIVAVAAYLGRPGRAALRWPSWPLTLLFAAAALADLVTTLAFFHTRGIDWELHPGMRLFGYAYGRTAGPMLGKLLQAMGVYFVAAASPRIGPYLLWLSSLLYAAAAVYNAGFAE